MAIRDDLKTQITTNLSSYTNFGVSSELPFDSGGNPMYEKNKRTVYLDEQADSKVQLYRTLDQGDVYQTDSVVQAYLVTDAKNQPSDINSVITAILDAKDAITGTQTNEATYETEIEDDYITYTFEYTFTNV